MIFTKTINLKSLEDLLSEEKIARYAAAIRSEKILRPYNLNLEDKDLVKAHIMLIIRSDYRNKVESHKLRESNKTIGEEL